jgi:hypothetical protein
MYNHIIILVLSQHSPRKSAEIHGNPQSERLVKRPRFQQVVSEVQFIRATAESI